MPKYQCKPLFNTKDKGKVDDEIYNQFIENAITDVDVTENEMNKAIDQLTNSVPEPFDIPYVFEQDGNSYVSIIRKGECKLVPKKKISNLNS